MKHKNLKWFFIGLSVSISAAVLARIEAWNYDNDPRHFSPTYEKSFFALPKSGVVSKRPWSDTYWPFVRGGLAWRWYTPSGVNKSNSATYYSNLYDYRSILQMSKAELSQLSPIEKFDIYLGNIYPDRPGYYKWFKTMRARTTESGRAMAGWEGLCHGWAAASIHTPEPAKILTPVNIYDPRDGQTKQIMMPFLSSDVKALLTFFYAEKQKTEYARYIGLACKTKSFRYQRNGRTYESLPNTTECQDVNAGAFFVALGNEIGLKKKSFLMDVSQNNEVWNHPVTSYQHKWLQERAPSRTASKEAVREIVVETQVSYMTEVDPYGVSFKGWDWQNAQETKIYRYSVELNAVDEVVGGEWLTADHPDFLWNFDRQEYSGDFAALNHLVIPAQ